MASSLGDRTYLPNFSYLPSLMVPVHLNLLILISLSKTFVKSTTSCWELLSSLSCAYKCTLIIITACLYYCVFKVLYIP